MKKPQKLPDDLPIVKGNVYIVISPEKGRGFSCKLYDTTFDQPDRSLGVLGMGLIDWVVKNAPYAMEYGLHVLSASGRSALEPISESQVLINRLVPHYDFRTDMSGGANN